MQIHHKNQIVILELDDNSWTATYPQDELTNSLFPLGKIPLPYNREASIEFVANELSKMQNNLQILHNEILYGSDIGGVIHVISPIPCGKSILDRPWKIECYNESFAEQINCGVFINKDRALNAARYCIEPMFGGYSFVKIFSTPDLLVTHHSPIDL